MLKIKIDTDNLQHHMAELAAMLREVADRLEDQSGANYCPNIDGTIRVGGFRYRG